jgi:hypothetical protein
MMSYSGMRGAVGVALGLMLKSNADSKEGSTWSTTNVNCTDPMVLTEDHKLLDREVLTKLMLFHICGIVFMSTLVNGTTAGMLYKYLAIYTPNKHRATHRQTALDGVKAKMGGKIIPKMQGQIMYAFARWDVVENSIPDFALLSFADGEVHRADPKGEGSDRFILQPEDDDAEGAANDDPLPGGSPARALRSKSNGVTSERNDAGSMTNRTESIKGGMKPNKSGEEFVSRMWGWDTNPLLADSKDRPANPASPSSPKSPAAAASVRVARASAEQIAHNDLLEGRGGSDDHNDLLENKYNLENNSLHSFRSGEDLEESMHSTSLGPAFDLQSRKESAYTTLFQSIKIQYTKM